MDELLEASRFILRMHYDLVPPWIRRGGELFYSVGRRCSGRCGRIYMDYWCRDEIKTALMQVVAWGIPAADPVIISVIL